MKSIDWDNVMPQRAPIDGLSRVNCTFPHQLEVDRHPDRLQYLLVFLCKNCDWVMVMRKHELRQVLMGKLPFDPDSVIYRAWYDQEGVYLVDQTGFTWPFRE